MRDDRKTKTELLLELNGLRGRLAELEGQEPVGDETPVEILSLRKASDGDEVRPTTASKVRDSNKLYRKLFANMTEGFAIHEVLLNEAGIPCDCRFVEVNASFTKLTGLKREDVVGHTVTEALPEVASFWVDVCGQVALTGHPIRFEGYSEATAKYWDVSVFGLVEGQFACIFSDITDRKRAEEALTDEMRLARTLLDEMPCVALLLRPSTREIVASNMPAVDVGAVPGKTCFATWTKRKTPCPFCLAPELWATGETQHCQPEYEGVTYDAYWVRVSDDLYLHYAFDISERKRAEEELRESEALLMAQFTNSPDIIVVIDRDYKIVAVNKVLTGRYAMGELKGMDSITMVHPESRDEARRRLDECFRSGEVQEFEHRLDEHIWLRARVARIGDGSESDRLMIISSDITERKRAEADLRNAKEFAENLIETANAIVVGLDLDGGIRVFNQGAEEITGYKQSELEGRNYFDVIVPRDRYPEVWQLFQKLTAGELPRNYENPILTKSGQERYIAWRNSEMREDGKVTGTISFGIDITEWKNAEQALRDSEEKFKRLFYQSPIGKAIVGLDNRHRLVNAELCRMFGCSQDELLSMTWIDLTHPDDVEENRLQTARLLAGEIDDYRCEKRYIRKDGETIWASVSVRLIRDADGRPLYFLPVIREITEQKQLEAMLRRSQRLEAVGKLAGGIAHEFKNLLMAISGYSEVLQIKLGPDHPQYSTTNDLLDCVDRAAKVINQLLAFSRKQPIEIHAVDLGQILKESDNLLRPLLGEQIAIRTQMPKSPLTVSADPGQIVQVLVNLAINARDAMPHGGALTIGARRVRPEDVSLPAGHSRPEGGEFAELTVSDTGTGMDEATRDRIFEPFFTTKDKRHRTGLGLSVAYGIIKQHGGQIHVSSKQGEGTVFHIYLPITLADPAAGLAERARRPGTGSETILLVEDEKQVRMPTKGFLEEYGYKVHAASDSTKAVELLNRHAAKIDLAIIDVVVPGGGGKSVWREMRKIRPDLKALFISGYPRKEVAKSTGSAARIPFLSKPFLLTELVAKVREILDEPGGDVV